jgi:formate/nitrite transporter FocA (FNT family)
VKSDGAWLEGRTSRPDLEALSWSGFAENLLPVTVGNVIGGTLLVGAVYWFVYLRPRRRSTPHDEAA